MCENVSKRVICITNLVVHVHGRPKGPVIIRDSFIHTYSTSGLDGNCVYACTTDYDRSYKEKCEMDLVIAQQLVQTWVMALVYWKLSRRGGSHGLTDVSSTNASLVSLLCTIPHTAGLYLTNPFWSLISSQILRTFNDIHCDIICRLMSGGTCQPLFTWQV